VHDELVFDVPHGEEDAVRPLIKASMENAMILPHGVPANVETGIGINWLEAH
jgi:DNA polymerase-1